MNFKQSVISLVVALLCVTVNVIASANVLSEHEPNLNFISFMSRSIDLMQRNPTRSQECFSYYIPLIEQITKTYQVNYEACVQATRDGNSQAEAATLEKRNDLVAHANKSCNLLSQCSEIASAEKVFECFVAGGSENIKTMYDVNLKASEHLADLQEEFRLIQNREFKCTNETKRTYEKESGEAYGNLNNCIMGISEVPTPTETPVEPESPENPENPATTDGSDSTENSEDPQNPESTVSDEILPEVIMPEEDISLYKYLNNRFT